MQRDESNLAWEVWIVQHHPAEGPALLSRAFRETGLLPRLIGTWRGDPLPTADQIGRCCGLVVLGGPQSADSDRNFPTRRAEMDLMAAALEAEVPTLGICLGAQMLALVAGGDLATGGEPEIGWGIVTLADESRDDPIFSGLECRDLWAVHWHGDQLVPPAGATVLGGTERYPEQAFRVGRTAWGIQFHLEADDHWIRSVSAAFPQEAARAEGGAEALLEQTAALERSTRPQRFSVLKSFARGVAQTFG
ncbi:MAG: GMP synthase [Acidimicrobiales bacterium]|nr:MAG: GMP synthase [Acidimicrobiales bacterium]